ncbi:hypothetical protein FRC07_015188 [Ceratobasidium sp. 392]|nr:hypothetical protein FRC07_015188 [Ceratobasidium sp. 392]
MTRRRYVAELTQGGITVGIGNAQKDNDRFLDGFQHRPVMFLDSVAKNIHSLECHIPATPGQQFCIHVAYDKGSSEASSANGAGLQADICLEKSSWVADVYWPTTELEDDNCEFEIEDYPVNEQGIYKGRCPFRFKQRTIIKDNPTGAKDPDDYWLATITVRVYWAFPDETSETEDQVDARCVEERLLEEQCSNELNEPLDKRTNTAKYELGIEYVPENARADLEQGPEREYKVKKAENKEYQFIFKYRTIEWLVDQKIAPRSRLPKSSNRGSSTPSSSMEHE